MKTFDFSRYLSLLRYDVLVRYRQMLRQFLLLAGIMFLILCLSVQTKTVPTWVASNMKATSNMFAAISCICLYVMVATSLADVKDMTPRMQYLLLPASRWEKYFHRLTMSVLVPIATVVAVWIAVDVLHMLVMYLRWGMAISLIGQISLPHLSLLPTREWVLIACWLVVLPHAFAFWCGCRFRRGPAVWSFVLPLAFGIMCGYLLVWLDNVLEECHMLLEIRIPDDNLTAFIYCADAVALLLALGFYALSARHFHRMQISRKGWLN